MTMMTSGWVVRTYRFFDDKRWLILSSAFSKLEKKLCLFVLFLWLKMKKKRFPFASKKQQLLSLLFVLFWFRPKWKKQVSLLLGFEQKKASATFFVCLFLFASPNDDNWWQVGRWYGIPNLVMTWWLRWVVVTKVSKCWWRHIEMVPKA